jgi:hypothetical protein
LIISGKPILGPHANDFSRECSERLLGIVSIGEGVPRRRSRRAAPQARIDKKLTYWPRNKDDLQNGRRPLTLEGILISMGIKQNYGVIIKV